MYDETLPWLRVIYEIQEKCGTGFSTTCYLPQRSRISSAAFLNVNGKWKNKTS